VTVYFSDGTMRAGQTYRISGSATGSTVVLAAVPPEAPGLTAVGLTSPATTTTASQTLRVTGPVGASVRVVRVEGGLFIGGVPGGGFDLEPFEANTALAVQEYTATIGAGGSVDIPVTLTKAPVTGGTTGLNHFVAVITGPGGTTGPLSPVVILQLQ
jgi:hypothetical protein